MAKVSEAVLKKFAQKIAPGMGEQIMKMLTPKHIAKLYGLVGGDPSKVDVGIVMRLLGGSAPGSKLSEEEASKYRVPIVEDAAYSALNAVATGLGATGRVVGSTNDILANALIAMGDRLTPANSKAIYGDPLGALLQIPAAARRIRGAAAPIVGNASETAIKDFSRTWKQRAQQNRDIDLFLNEGASGAFIDAKNKGVEGRRYRTDNSKINDVRDSSKWAT